MLRHFTTVVNKRIVMRVCEKKLILISELHDSDRRYRSMEDSIEKKGTCENIKKPVKNDSKQ